MAFGAITGLILAGGRGSRMGGVDKGLQAWRGQPLVMHVLQRLAPQVERVMINANRNIDAYERLGVPVWADTMPGFAGPLAGFIAGLEHCRTRWMVTVPCDTPLFPLNLVARLAEAAEREAADIAMPQTLRDGELRTQPVFCLMRTELLEDLVRHVEGGGRKTEDWALRHRCAFLVFDRPGDAASFFNANSPEDLRR